MGISENLSKIKAKIRTTAERVGRNPEAISLVAVTKTVGIQEIKALLDAGHSILGENRPQALRDRMKELPDLPVRWHFIGTLQANKIKYVYPFVEMVHSVDSVDLLENFGEWFRKTGRRCPCLLEVRISSESTKHGFSIGEIPTLLRNIQNRPDLDVRGFMGMAPFVEDSEIIRRSFRSLNDLFSASKEFEGPAFRASELSMGMSDDFPIAIEEGSTMVRIGRALFEGVSA